MTWDRHRNRLTSVACTRELSQRVRLQTDDITTSASWGSKPARTTGERCQPARRSEHPELQFRGVRHPVFVPRWVPDDVHVGVGDAGQLLQLVDDFDGKAL